MDSDSDVDIFEMPEWKFDKKYQVFDSILNSTCF